MIGRRSKSAIECVIMKAYLSIAACILLFLGAVFWTTNLVIPLFMYLAVTGIARELRFWKDTPDRLDYLIGMGIFRRVMAVTFGCIASIVAVWGLWSGIRTGDRWASSSPNASTPTTRT